LCTQVGFGTQADAGAGRQVEVSKGPAAFGGESPRGVKPLSVPLPKQTVTHLNLAPLATGG